MYTWPDNESIVSRQSLEVCEVLYIYMVSFAAMHWFNSFAGSRPPGTPALPEDIVRGSARAPGSRWARGHWEGGGAGNYMNSWWRHQMETFSALLALCAENSPVTGEFPSQRPVRRSFDVFFDLRMNKRLSKQLSRRWFETPSRPLWRHCNVEKWRNS